MYLKTFEMAFLEMVRHLRADLGTSLDLVEGSDASSLVEAVAFQVADLSERQERSILDAIPESTFAAFGFAALLPKQASGTLSFYTPVPAADVILIPAGSEAYSDDDLVFMTTQDAWIAPSQTSVLVPAVAQAGGAAGNIPALTIKRMGSGILGIQGVNNPAPFTGGTDGETLEAQTARFAAFWQSLNRSNKSGLRGAVLGASADGEQAADTLILDSDDDANIPPAYCVVCAYRYGTVSAALQAQIRQAVELARAGGIVVQFEWTNGTPVNIEVNVNCPDLTQQTSALANVEQAVRAYFATLRYGQKASYENLITLCTTAHPAILEVKVTTPTLGDVPCSQRQHLELGSLTITAGNA